MISPIQRRGTIRDDAVTLTNMPISISAPPSIHYDYSPPVYRERQESVIRDGTIRHPASPESTDQQSGGQEATQVTKNRVAIVYERLAFCIFSRWILAIAILSMSVVVINHGPADLLRYAATYSITVAATHLSFPGYPKLGPSTPDDARLPRWFKFMLVLTTVGWIPCFVLTLHCYAWHNVSRQDYDIESNYIWTLVVAVGILALIEFFISCVIYGYSSRLKRQAWDTKSIAEVYYRHHNTWPDHIYEVSTNNRREIQLVDRDNIV